MRVAIVPQPVRVVESDGAFRWQVAETTVRAVPEDVAAVRTVLGGCLPSLETSSPAAPLRIRRDSSLEAEGYRLVVDATGIDIGAGERTGVLWALQTLRQLMGPDAFVAAPIRDAFDVPYVEIDDHPRFGWRGSMLDTARHFRPVREVLAYVDQLAIHKLNVFHWHLTEDQGWRFESRRYPRLTEVGSWRPGTTTPAYGFDGLPEGGYYTVEQMRQVVQYARDRGITVVPEIEFPGHVVAALAAYPEFACPGDEVTSPATGFGVFDSVLDMSDASLAFALGVWEEVLDVFDSPYVHIGGDEVPTTRWVDDAPIEARARALGLSGASHLQQWFTEELVGWLRARGKIAVAWDEAFGHGAVTDAVCMAWRQAADRVEQARAGGSVVVAPSSHTYFDYYADPGPEEPYAIGGLTSLQKAYGFDPLEHYPGELGQRVLGTQFQVWSEYLPTMGQVEYMAWPRGCALAEVAWSPAESRSWDDFVGRLDRHLGRLNASGIGYRPLAGPRPWQQGGTGRRARPPVQAW